MNDIQTLLDHHFPKAEPLDPELEARIEITEHFPMIHHPLVVAAPYHEPMNASYNQMLRTKRKQLAEANRNKHWKTYVYLHERPYRLEAFLDLYHGDALHGPETYADLLADIWVDCESPHINKRVWISLFKQVDDRMLLMNEDEQKVLQSMPEVVEIYRGQDPNYEWGISWTLDPDRAKFFAKRWKQDGRVFHRKVLRANILAYFDSRSEQEVVVLPDDII